ncbi:MAG: hypothetical protein HYR72_15420 [Deltaproteobacteria bacterium]|nr:hypothetical protein [Deltaproteobacteria bacterium]MBI3390190.1 hypothetical protein [Deltaproteobacteria bacterium]
MMLVQLHLIAVSFWLGMVAAETVLEFCGRDAVSRRTVAVAHRWIDLLFEIPVVIVVVGTGTLLLARAWPASPLLLVKVGAGSIAVIANLICVPLVHARWKETDDARVRALTRQVKMTGLAIPFAIAALVIGLGFLPLR